LGRTRIIIEHQFGGAYRIVQDVSGGRYVSELHRLLSEEMRKLCGD
jgi:hypothetical protein